MNKSRLAKVLAITTLLGLIIAAQEPAPRREPLTFVLDCPGGDCPLLKRVPQTSGMRGGSVRLEPGESVGRHSTGQNEEALTILKGSGAARIEDHADVPLHAKMLAYIPPGTRHNVTNTGAEVLKWARGPLKLGDAFPIFTVR